MKFSNTRWRIATTLFTIVSFAARVIRGPSPHLAAWCALGIVAILLAWIPGKPIGIFLALALDFPSGLSDAQLMYTQLPHFGSAINDRVARADIARASNEQDRVSAEVEFFNVKHPETDFFASLAPKRCESLRTLLRSDHAYPHLRLRFFSTPQCGMAPATSKNFNSRSESLPMFVHNVDAANVL